MNLPPLVKKALAEFLGVLIFLTAIVGSVLNQSSQLAAPALATALGLAILVTGPISGGHLNPAVSIYFLSRREISVVEFLTYIVAQLAGAVAGVYIATQIWAVSFGPTSSTEMATPAMLIAELFATGGLVWLVGRLASTGKGNLIPAAVGLWVFAAATFTPTGAQANPAVSIGLLFIGQPISTQAGIILAQLVGMLIAAVFVVIFADKAKKAAVEK
ncbi:MAG: hypothetical protein RL149_108 [Actinomycetota bacterium]|jgi:glycerol uptake facilitator-like aquaporin